MITASGFARLQQELNFLWKEKRPEVTARVAAAAALGDRSENADYIYGKRQLGEIDRRIRYLDKRIRTMQVVDRLPADKTKVYFGAWVTLEGVDADSTGEISKSSPPIASSAQMKLTSIRPTSASIPPWLER